MAKGGALEEFYNQDLKCPICLYPFKEPTSISCNHTFCSTCIYAALRIKPSCPICSRHSTKRMTRPNKTMEQLIENVVLLIEARAAEEKKVESKPTSSSSSHPRSKRTRSSVVVALPDSSADDDNSSDPVPPPSPDADSLKIILFSGEISSTISRSIRHWKLLGNIMMVTVWTPGVTHVLVESEFENGMWYSTKSSLKVLNAMARGGAWIVSRDWVHECIAQEAMLSEEAFEVVGIKTKVEMNKAFLHGPSRARKATCALFQGQKFSLRGTFGHDRVPEKKDLIALLSTAGGGTVVSNLSSRARTEPSVIVIWGGRTKAGSAAEVGISTDWVLDSVFAFERRPLDDYRI